MPQITGKDKKKISLRHRSFTEKEMEDISSKEALFHALPRGSLTLEAALVLPLFLFAVATLLSLFLMMQVQYTVGNALDGAVADTALLRKESEKKVENMTKAAFYKELTVQNCPLSRIQFGAAGFSWKGTKVDEAYIDAQVTYCIKFPISFFGKKTMEVSDGCRMHRWTGRRKEDGAGDGEEWVFVTPAQKVYHVSRECSHLKLSVKAVGAEKLKQEGFNYDPCGHCTKGQKMGATIYITAEGACYHYRLDCSGLKRTIYMIPKKQVGNKKPCSRCGGK